MVTVFPLAMSQELSLPGAIPKILPAKSSDANPLGVLTFDQTWGLVHDGALLTSLAGKFGALLGPDFDVFRVTLTSLVSSSKSEAVVAVVLSIGDKPGKLNNLTLHVQLTVKQEDGRAQLESNRLFFKFPNLDKETLDLEAFALVFEPKKLEGPLGREFHHGYLDLESLQFVFDEKQSIELLLPGGLNGQAPEQVKDRFRFQLKALNPSTWPVPASPPDKDVLFVVGVRGLSFSAQVKETEVVVADAVQVATVAKRGSVDSRVVIINNELKAAVVMGNMPVPGMQNVQAELTVTLRYDGPGIPLKVDAQLEITGKSGKPAADLSIGYAHLAVDTLKLELNWVAKDSKWHLTTEANGSLSLVGEVAAELQKLQSPSAIRVQRLNLQELLKGEVSQLPLNLEAPVELSVLNGLIACRIEALQLSWDGESVRFLGSQVSLTVDSPGALEMTLISSALDVHIGKSGSGVTFPGTLGLEMKIGSSCHYKAVVGWHTPVFTASGILKMEGFPEVKTFLKLGSERKRDGQMAPSIVLYGAVGLDVALFTGVQVKQLGAGIGINNRLVAMGDAPNAEDIVKNIDQITPESEGSWKFVEANGFFLSLVASCVLAGQPGDAKVVQTYVASLILSLDLDLNVMAAGKLWLFSSPGFTDMPENKNHPALIGAIAMAPKTKMITAALQTGSRPAVEANDQIKDLLSKATVKFSFTLSPDLVDFFLEELSYKATIFGVPMLFSGSFRMAIFDGTVLLKARLDIHGSYRNECTSAVGGFRCFGELSFHLEFGGLISAKGLMAYGGVDLRVTLDVEAWVDIHFSITIDLGFWEETFEFSLHFELGKTRLELGLCGQVAFDEGGNFSFFGSLHISISICGYGLELTASLAYNKELYDQVRGRVAAFEDRLNRFKQAAVAAGGVGALLGANASPRRSVDRPRGQGAERSPWLLYAAPRVDGPTYFLLVPRAHGEGWFVTGYTEEGKSYRFNPGSIERVVIYCAGSSQPVEVVPPWLPDSSADARRQKRLAAALLETVPNGVQSPNRDLSTYRVVQDPTPQTCSRAWCTYQDQFHFPDYALPYEIRPWTQLIAEGAPGNLADLQQYHLFRESLLNGAAHRPEDSDDEADSQRQLHLARAALVRSMLQDLRRPQGPEDFPGWIFSLQSGQEIVKIEVWRKGRPSPECLDFQLGEQASGPPRDRVRRLPPRQKWVAREGLDSGAVLVKLPVQFEDTLLTQDLEQVGHFQIFRRFPWEKEPVCIASYVPPEILFQHHEIQSQDGTVSLDPAIVVNPYLFTDTFEVKQGRFDVFGLVAGRTEIQYSLRMVPQGEADGKTDVAEVLSWPPVRLFVPEGAPFPLDLNLVIAVESLTIPDPTKPIEPASVTAWITFRLVQERPAEANGVPRLEDAGLRLLDFEIWAQELLPVQSGFYGTADFDTSAPRDRQTPDPHSLGADRLFESTAGKRRLQVDSLKDGVYSLGSEFAPRPGYRYRLFIRSARSAQGALTYPLTLKICRELSQLQSFEQARYTDCLEWFRPKRATELLSPQRFQAFSTLSDPDAVDQKDKEIQNLLRFAWSSLGHMEGGVEFLVTDQDDPTFTFRQSCEVMEESLFSRSERSFAVPGRWTLTDGLESVRRGACRQLISSQTPAATPSGFDAGSDGTNFGKACTKLSNHLDGLNSSLEWRHLVLAGRIWLGGDPQRSHEDPEIPLHSFFKSNDNLDDFLVHLCAEAVVVALRWLVMGFVGLPAAAVNVLAGKQGEDEADSLATWKQFLEQARSLESELLKNLEKAQAPTTAPPRTTAELLDMSCEREFAEMVRRRLACAEELLDQRPLAPVAKVSDWAQLPCGPRWKRVIKRLKDKSQADYPRSAWFLSRFPVDLGDTRQQGWGQLTSTVELAKTVIQKLVYLTDTQHPSTVRNQRLIKTLPHCTAIRDILAALTRQCGGSGDTLVVGTHHVLGTSRSQGTGEKVPVFTNIADLMPHAAPGPNGANLQGTFIVSCAEAEIFVHSLSGDNVLVPHGVLRFPGSKMLDAAAIAVGSRLIVWATGTGTAPNNPNNLYGFWERNERGIWSNLQFELPFNANKVALAIGPEGLYLYASSDREIRYQLLAWGLAPSWVGSFPEEKLAGTVSNASGILQSLSGPAGPWVLTDNAVYDKSGTKIHDVSKLLPKRTGCLRLYLDSQFDLRLLSFHENSVTAYTLPLPVPPPSPSPSPPPPATEPYWSVTLDEPVSKLTVLPSASDLIVCVESTVSDAPGKVSVWQIEPQSPPAKGKVPVAPILKLPPMDNPSGGFFPSAESDHLAVVVGNQLSLYDLKQSNLSARATVALPPGKLVSCLAPASPSPVLARELMHLFTLFERLGFAVDLSIRGNRLQGWSRQAEIVEKVTQCLKDNPSISKTHQVNILCGHEPDPGTNPIGYGFVKLIAVPRDFLALLQTPGCDAAIAGWFESRSIKLPGPEQNSSLIRHLRQLAQYLGAYPPAAKPDTLTFVATGQRWVTVPSRGNFCRSLQVIPDLRGHRFQVQARSLSRYEPLLQWSEKLSLDFPRDQTTVQLAQTRRIFEPDAKLEVLLADVFFHAHRIQFGYYPPVEGARSIYNNISAIRTGYRGSDLSFQYRMREQEILEKLLIDKNLKGPQPGEAENVPVEFLKLAPVYDTFPPGPEPDLPLFRHERLLVLENLPYFYEYALEVRSSYDAERAPTGDSATSGLRWANRRPGRVGVPRFVVSPVDGTGRFTLTLGLAAHRHHLTFDDVAGAPPRLVLKSTTHPSPEWPELLLDLAMGYSILRRVSKAPARTLYSPLCDYSLSLNPSYTDPLDPPPSNPGDPPQPSPSPSPSQPPKRQISSFQSYLPTTGGGGAELVNAPVIRFQTDTNFYHYWVQIQITDITGPPVDLDDIFVQASRDGFLTRPFNRNGELG